MSNIFNSKTEKTSAIVSNIKIIKIIAIILGLLIILGLFFLFWGLAESYKNINSNKETFSKAEETKIGLINKFDFNEPADAQLISSSLGLDNQMLLRYLYKGENVLVILDIQTKEISSIITIKKSNETFKIN